MDIEFHYYITYLIANGAGFDDEESKTIAFASQFVDDNDLDFTLDKSKPSEYKNIITQTMNITKPAAELVRVYPFFHFVPGDPNAPTARRKDGKTSPLITTPDNENARQLFIFATEQKNKPNFLHHLGIASHVYVDTWAHQNFIGRSDHMNGIDFIPLPNIGHADAMHNPDIPNHTWLDSRLIPEIGNVDNNERFFAAGNALYNRYRGILSGRGEKASWTDILGELQERMNQVPAGSEGSEGRIAQYREMANIPLYYKWDEWFDEAVKAPVTGLKDADNIYRKNVIKDIKENFPWKDASSLENTNWHKFQEGAKAHDKKAFGLLNPTFAKLGIPL